LEALNDKLLAFFMVTTRISAFILLVPIFSLESTPVRIKAAIILLLSLFFTYINPVKISSNISIIQIVLLLCGEATYGLALGLITNLIFSAVRLSARITEREMGFTFAEVLDPLTGEQDPAFGIFIEMIFMLVFLSANGHHALLTILSRSCSTVPIGDIPAINILTNAVIEAGSAMFIAGLRLAAPVLAAFILLLVILAVLARAAPEMNILLLSLPMKIGLGFIMSIIFLDFISGFVSEFADWMNKLLPI